jgi:hypothetical protein
MRNGWAQKFCCDSVAKLPNPLRNFPHILISSDTLDFPAKAGLGVQRGAEQ